MKTTLQARPRLTALALAAAFVLAVTVPAQAQHAGHGQDKEPAKTKAHDGHGAAQAPAKPPEAPPGPSPGVAAAPPSPAAPPAPSPGVAAAPAASATAKPDHSGHGAAAPASPKASPAAPAKTTPAGQAATPAAHVPGVATVTITPEQAQAIGVATRKAESRAFRKVVRASGRVEVDERRLVAVTAKAEGFLERLLANHVGMQVRKGQALASIYSPEVYALQLEYLALLRASRGAAALSPVPSAAAGEAHPEVAAMLEDGNRALLQAVRQRLALLDAGGLTASLERGGNPSRSYSLASPVDGFVMRRMATQGMRVMPGEPLLELADLSTVWVLGEVFEQDLPFVQPGQKASIALPGLGGAPLSARLEHILPSLAGDTRTARLRFSLPNPKGQLKPEMFAEIQMDADLGVRLAVPDQAVIDTGERRIVYVDDGQGRFSLREVTTGVSSDGFVEIVSGLKPGEAVVSQANFLIDAETRLKGSGGASHQH